MLYDYIFPKFCRLCSKRGLYICDRCRRDIFRSLPKCFVCKELSNGFKTHERCKKVLNIKSCYISYLLPRDMEYLVKKDIENDMYELFKEILNYEIINRYTVIPLVSKNRNVSNINKSLCKKFKNDKKDILLFSICLIDIIDIRKQIEKYKEEEITLYFLFENHLY